MVLIKHFFKKCLLLTSKKWKNDTKKVPKSS